MIYDLSSKLIEKGFVNGFESFLPEYYNNSQRYETPDKRKSNEEKIHSLIKDLEKETREFLSLYVEDIKLVADYMYKKGSIKFDELKTLNLKILSNY